MALQQGARLQQAEEEWARTELLEAGAALQAALPERVTDYRYLLLLLVLLLRKNSAH